MIDYEQQLLILAKSIFITQERTDQWLDTPNKTLYYDTPRQHLKEHPWQYKMLLDLLMTYED